MNTIAIVLVVVLVLFTIALSIFSRRFTRTTADFYLAGRKVGSFSNASAISGDYLSAASFLGVAGAVYASGLDGVWYAAGFAGGFMVVVLFIASALRRFGEYTVADFAFGRFGTNRIRLVTVLAVLLVVALLHGAADVRRGHDVEGPRGQGILAATPTDSSSASTRLPRPASSWSPRIMMFYVAVGGMKGTTLNQIFQFWWLWFAMFLVVVFAFGNGFSYPEDLAEASDGTLVDDQDHDGRGAHEGRPEERQGADRQRRGDHAARVVREGRGGRRRRRRDRQGRRRCSRRRTSCTRLRDMLFGEPGHRYNAFDQFSMVLALVLGTAGLPHILNRYYTNPPARPPAARRSGCSSSSAPSTSSRRSPAWPVVASSRTPLRRVRAPANAALVDGLLVKSDAAHADARLSSSAGSGSWVSWPQARSRPCSPPSAVC